MHESMFRNLDKTCVRENTYMKLTMLGTGNAAVTKCYNTCFVIEDDGACFMVDGGGGNTVFQQLEKAGYRWQDMHDIFLTHKHMDHIMGVLWMVRMICQGISRGKCSGEYRIYGHEEVIGLLRSIAEMLLNEKEITVLDHQLQLIVVEDGETREINGRKVTFFDIHSKKAKQFGFSIQLDDDERLTCCGEEPYHPSEEAYARGSKWLLHEAFCLYSQAEIFEPYKKSHSTVKDACVLAETLGVENLVLYHTEDKNIGHRKVLYTEEGSRYFSGNLYVPEDLEVIHL